MIRQTSIEAYHAIKESGLLSRRRFQVYDILFHHGPLTAGEVFQLGLQEGTWSRAVKGGICARLTELRDVGVAEEKGTRTCSLSGQKTILWDVTPRLPIKFDKPKKHRCQTCDGKGFIVETQARLF